jgi:hypothetical protein
MDFMQFREAKTNRPLNCHVVVGGRARLCLRSRAITFWNEERVGQIVMKKLSVLLAVLLFSAVAFAGSVSVNFTDSGYTVVTNQYLTTDGVTFSNALELTTGDGDVGPGMDYPLPPNGSNILTNDPADPLTMNMTGTFTNQGALAGNYVYSLSFYYTTPIGGTVTAYNINGVAIATLTLTANNGSSTLETLTVPGCSGASYSAGCVIAYVTFSDGGVPDSLTIGEVTLTDAATPEPGTLALFGSGVLAFAGVLRRRHKLGAISKKATPMLLAVVAFLFVFNGASLGEAARVITGQIDDNNRITIVGNTRPEVFNKNLDRGPVNDSFDMGHMLLQLKRTPKNEAALEKLIDQMHDPKSPNFHKFMGVKEFGKNWGVSMDDINTIVSWLQVHGFQIEGIFPSRMVIGFSGTAGQVREAFGVEERMFHDVRRNEDRNANTSDPKIPAALAPVVEGIVGLNSFRPNMPHHKWNPEFYTGGSSWPQAVVPDDLQTIYNAKPLFEEGITGAGQTIVVVEDTNIYNPPTGCTVGSATCTPLQPGNSASGDLGLFRNVMGLSRFDTAPVPIQGTNVIFNQLNPVLSLTGPYPDVTCNVPSTTAGAGTGVNDDASEAAIDVEYAGALAPGANIVNAACADPSGSFGGLIALENILNLPGVAGSFSTCPAVTLTTTAGAMKEPACILSMSYGEGEVVAGATLVAAFNSAFEQGVAEGMSLFVSSGDSGAAVNNGNGATSATDGISVSGWAADSQYAVSVGGSDYADEFCTDIPCANFVGTSATYWNNYNNTWYGSAKGYVPEIPWGDSCATVMLSTLLGTAVPPVGASSECNVSSTFRTTGGGSGGPSGCATGTASSTSVVSGSCKGFAKPTFQSSYIGVLPGMPNDGVRDQPDISAFAANGLSGHLLPACFSGTYSGAGGFTCGTIAAPTRPINAANTTYWWIGGGTSFASPIMAGSQALVNQFKNAPQGNPNPRYYALAANGGSVNSGPYGSAVANCNASLGDTINSGCIFHDSTLGDMDVNCTGAHNCYIPSSTRGVLNTGAVTTVTTQPTCTGCTTATTFSCTVAGPSNLGPYKTINGATTLYTGGVQATCSVSSTSGSVLTLTITAGGAGYVTLPLSTVAITGGPGSITAQAVLTSTVSATTGYQPAFETNPGYDMATGIGSPNVYNLVHNY